MTPLTVDTIKTVGSNGDFQTVNQALEYFSGYYPIYKKGGINAEIKLLNGFVMAEQILVSGIELGWVRITSETTEVTVDASALTVPFYNFYPLFGVDGGGSLPRIDTMFNYSGTSAVYNKHGILVVGAGSSANVSADIGGIKNAHGHALFAERNGAINAERGKFTGAKKHGAYALCNASINVGHADLTGATDFGVYSIGSSMINAGGTIVSGANVGCYASENSFINAAEMVADNCVYAGIYAVRNSHICAHGAFVRNQVQGNCCVSALDGSYVEARYIVTTGSTVPIYSTAINALTVNGIISA